MEVVSNPSQDLSIRSQVPSLAKSKVDLNEVLLKDAPGARLKPSKLHGKGDKVDFDLSAAYKSLSITADKIVRKLNEMLAEKLPDGLQSLKPAETTPEATAERIVRGATAFFGLYQKQNPDLQGEELLNGFLNTIKGGIDQGYGDAFSTLEGLGAFEIEGVQEGVEQTRKLIDEKLVVYESEMRKRLGLDPIDIKEGVAQSVFNEITAAAKSSGSLAIAA